MPITVTTPRPPAPHGQGTLLQSGSKNNKIWKLSRFTVSLRVHRKIIAFLRLLMLTKLCKLKYKQFAITLLKFNTILCIIYTTYSNYYLSPIYNKVLWRWGVGVIVFCLSRRAGAELLPHSDIWTRVRLGRLLYTDLLPDVKRASGVRGVAIARRLSG